MISDFINTKLSSTGLRWLWIALLILVLDFSTKNWIINYCPMNEFIHITSYICFTYIYNTGAAFGFLADENGWQCWILSLITIILVIILLKIMYSSNYNYILVNIACSMIIGGAFGNLFNRLTYGAVIDFICFRFGNWQLPIFNIADVSICIGIILIVLDDYMRSIKKKYIKK